MASRSPKLHKISEEMQQWAALLSSEVSQWPDVSLKSMFGMTAFYRKATIFGAAPATRSLGSPNSIIFKIVDPPPAVRLRVEADARVGTSGDVGQKWYSFELSSPKDLRDALNWFSEAYEKAKPSQSKKRIPRRKKPS